MYLYSVCLMFKQHYCSDKVDLIFKCSHSNSSQAFHLAGSVPFMVNTYNFTDRWRTAQVRKSSGLLLFRPYFKVQNHSTKTSLSTWLCSHKTSPNNEPYLALKGTYCYLKIHLLVPIYPSVRPSIRFL